MDRASVSIRVRVRVIPLPVVWMRTASPLLLSLLPSGTSLWYRTALCQCPRSLYSLRAETPGRSSSGRVRGLEDLALATVVINVASCDMVVLFWECAYGEEGGGGLVVGL